MTKHILFISTVALALAPSLARAGGMTRAPAQIDFNQLIEDSAGEGSDLHARIVGPAESPVAKASGMESGESPSVTVAGASVPNSAN